MHAHVPEPPGHDPDIPPEVPPPDPPGEDIDLPPREDPPPVRDPEVPPQPGRVRSRASCRPSRRILRAGCKGSSD